MSIEVSKITLPETDIAPENRPSQEETSIPTIQFQVRTVSFSKGTIPWDAILVCYDETGGASRHLKKNIRRQIPVPKRWKHSKKHKVFLAGSFKVANMAFF